MQQMQPRTIWLGVGVLVLVLYLTLSPQKHKQQYAGASEQPPVNNNAQSSEFTSRFARLERELAAAQRAQAQAQAEGSKTGPSMDLATLKELFESVKRDTAESLAQLKHDLHEDTTKSLTSLKKELGGCSCETEVSRVKAALKIIPQYGRTIEQACELAKPHGGCWRRGEKDPQFPEYVSYSQLGQDLTLRNMVFGNMSDGAFIEMGAFNGMGYANTPGWETYSGWRGLCIEGNPRLFEMVENTRPLCLDVNGVVSNLKGEVDFLYSKEWKGPNELAGIKQFLASLERVKREAAQAGAPLSEAKVKSFTLPDVLLHFGYEIVDLFVLDVEGAELPVLQTLQQATDSSGWPDDPNKASPPNGLKEGEGWERLQFRVLLIENNQGTAAIHDLVTAKGYERIAHAQDSFYVKKDWPHGNKGHAYHCRESNCMGMRNRADYYEQRAEFLKKHPQK